jgi:hypothetical protein
MDDQNTAKNKGKAATNTGLDVGLWPAAFALRPVRMMVKQNRFRFYSAITFPNGPWKGCELYLRRCKAFGYLTDDGTGLTIDVLDEAGNILQGFSVTRTGFDYLRQKLKFIVEEE